MLDSLGRTLPNFSLGAKHDQVRLSINEGFDLTHKHPPYAHHPMTQPAPNQFQLERCPHCGSDAQVEPHGEFRFKCRACGRPRIPFDAREPTPPQVAALLKQAGSARAGKLGWAAAGWGLAILSACSALFTLGVGALFDAGVTGYGVMGFFTLIPVLLSVLTFRASKTAGEKSRQALDQAWSEAVGALYRARGGRLNGPELARAMGINTDYATQLLAEAEVQQLLDPSLDEPVRVRVSVDQSAALDPDEAAAEQELLEALGQAKTQSFKAKT